MSVVGSEFFDRLDILLCGLDPRLRTLLELVKFRSRSVFVGSPNSEMIVAAIQKKIREIPLASEDHEIVKSVIGDVDLPQYVLDFELSMSVNAIHNDLKGISAQEFYSLKKSETHIKNSKVKTDLSPEARKPKRIRNPVPRLTIKEASVSVPKYFDEALNSIQAQRIRGRLAKYLKCKPELIHLEHVPTTETDAYRFNFFCPINGCKKKTINVSYVRNNAVVENFIKHYRRQHLDEDRTEKTFHFDEVNLSSIEESSDFDSPLEDEQEILESKLDFSQSSIIKIEPWELPTLPEKVPPLEKSKQSNEVLCTNCGKMVLKTALKRHSCHKVHSTRLKRKILEV